MQHPLILVFIESTSIGLQTGVVSLYMKNGNFLEHFEAYQSPRNESAKLYSPLSDVYAFWMLVLESSYAAQEKNMPHLPNELLLEVWDHLPPMERIAVSQVCRKWRGISLSTPRLWSRVIFLFTKHSDGCRCLSCSSQGSHQFDIYRPPPRATNLAFLGQILPRSADLPLDVTFVLSHTSSVVQNACLQFLNTHSNRIARIHSDNGLGVEIYKWINTFESFPALRTVTAGFDDREIEYCDLPVRRCPNTPFPVLNQIHIGAEVDYFGGFLGGIPMPSLQELTITPSRVNEAVQRDLRLCPNLTRLNVVMARFPLKGMLPYVESRFRQLAKIVANIREVCLLDIAAAHEANTLNAFNSRRHRHLILDYQGRPRVAGSFWYLSLPSPCDALGDAVRLTLRLRESVYEIDVRDALGHRREVLLDLSTIRIAPGLWDCYVSKKRVLAATVEALAWDYFASGLPRDCEIPELTIVVSRAPGELENVSLARFASLRTLHIASLRARLHLEGAILRHLVDSRAQKGETLPVLSVCANVLLKDTDSLSQVVANVECSGSRAMP
ncbi:hypothetical protein AURDEDRAFT_173916 [Auricularia subglabra TFB-10046 SS5]|uniref:F-box domain-containing protein n=1 Tax=Auricularia subglabra (strain TFB-10046 / SS5) TaxID=717982 RepID=J0DA40_AURST|nr:hypothetical protein AURDEDRAFT_173916 [Auricularia subglabra TFB-10046 SS5]